MLQEEALPTDIHVEFVQTDRMRARRHIHSKLFTITLHLMQGSSMAPPVETPLDEAGLLRTLAV